MALSRFFALFTLLLTLSLFQYTTAHAIVLQNVTSLANDTTNLALPANITNSSAEHVVVAPRESRPIPGTGLIVDLTSPDRPQHKIAEAEFRELMITAFDFVNFQLTTHPEATAAQFEKETQHASFIYRPVGTGPVVSWDDLFTALLFVGEFGDFFGQNVPSIRGIVRAPGFGNSGIIRVITPRASSASIIAAS